MQQSLLEALQVTDGARGAARPVGDVVEGFDGDDTVDFSAISLATFVDSGAGDDSVIGGGGNDTLRGVFRGLNAGNSCYCKYIAFFMVAGEYHF